MISVQSGDHFILSKAKDLMPEREQGIFRIARSNRE
jgi:hypothetical protein